MTTATENALALIDACADERVLFVGETITDEYRYVAPLARPPKEMMLAVRSLSAEEWAGGVMAAREHAKGFLQTGILTRPHAVRKIRYVEENYGHKLFEAQEINDAAPLADLPADILGRYDTLAVTDYGHGMFDTGAVQLLQARKEFLAVAVQTNSANAGFNLVTKYQRADYVVIDEPEARLAAADKAGPLEQVMRRLAFLCDCRRFVVTHGRHGAWALVDDVLLHQPAMSERVVDTMGAGDAFFAVTAGMARRTAEFGGMATLLAVGCAAGAVKCGIMGHRGSVTREAVMEVLRARAG